ncbi:MAG: SecD/SecF family protein translocase subunit, partial [Candidatus Roizmanbacteria bacterium]|nr:SecD/SecF family protein translocase subunit [Candidatus Roizmanbacteria bacterium]
IDGNAVISGTFTTDEAKKLAIAINSGALPLPIQLIEQRNIGPSLGADDVRKSVLAGGVGLFMVCFFMIGYYGKLGVIATGALALYGMLTFAMFRAIPIVLTLPGIAGFILSIGMAVDSNILIFERIKEEQRKGKDFKTAIRLGFGRALDAIKDANITTMLVAFICLYFIQSTKLGISSTVWHGKRICTHSWYWSCNKFIYWCCYYKTINTNIL